VVKFWIYFEDRATRYGGISQRLYGGRARDPKFGVIQLEGIYHQLQYRAIWKEKIKGEEE